MKLQHCLAAIAAALLMAGATPPAVATPITYTLVDASATFGTLGTVDFTGSFTFDAAINPLLQESLLAVSIKATGPVIQSNPENFNDPSFGQTNFFQAIGDATDRVNFTFSVDLSVAVDQITNVNL
jgi:hypothetical protein